MPRSPTSPILLFINLSSSPMKNRLATVFSLLALLAGSSTLAQNGLWPTANAEWRVTRNMAAGITVPHPTNPNQLNIINGWLNTEIRYHLGNPMVANGHSWTELWQTYESTFVSMDPDTTVYYPEVTEYRGAMREEGSRVYWFDLGGTAGQLLYDFDLSVGDTLPESFIHYNNNAIVASIDTLWMDGAAHKRFNLVGNGILGNYIIEGVGTNHGPIQHLGLGIDIVHGLNCFGRNGVTLFPDTSTACNSTTSIAQAKHEAQRALQVWPNPVASTATVTFKGLAVERLQLINVAGQVVWQQRIAKQQGPSVVLSLPELPNGYYVLKAQAKDGSAATTRLAIAR